MLFEVTNDILKLRSNQCYGKNAFKGIHSLNDSIFELMPNIVYHIMPLLYTLFNPIIYNGEK